MSPERPLDVVRFAEKAVGFIGNGERPGDSKVSIGLEAEPNTRIRWIYEAFDVRQISQMPTYRSPPPTFVIVRNET